MPRKSDAKENMIKAGAKLFHQKGYHAVGLTELLEESGAPKGSFYHHFPEGKDQLAEQSLLYSGRKLGEKMELVFIHATSFNQGIDHLAQKIAEWFEESNYQAGCPIATVILDTTPESGRIHYVAKQIYADWVNTLTGHAMRLEETTEEKAREKAEAILLAFEGAWIVARAQKSLTPFKLAGKLCKAI